MDRSLVIASYRRTVEYARQTAEICDAAEAARTSSMLDAFDLVLMAVGAAGVAAAAANLATDQAEHAPNVARAAVQRAMEAVCRVAALLDSLPLQNKLEPLFARIEGHRLSLGLAVDELRPVRQVH